MERGLVDDALLSSKNVPIPVILLRVGSCG